MPEEQPDEVLQDMDGDEIPQIPIGLDDRIAAKVEKQKVTHEELGNKPLPLRYSSLFVFGPNNFFRNACYDTIAYTPFNVFIFLLISLSCVLMAASPPWKENAELNVAFLVLNICFAVEAALKIIGLGLFLHPGSYFRSVWNWVDFIVVVVALVPMSSTNTGALRIFRVLRPLRYVRAIRRLDGLSRMVNGVFHSFPNYLAIMAAIIVCGTMASTCAVVLWAGELRNRCQGSSLPTNSVQLCDKGVVAGSTYTGRACPANSRCLDVGENPEFGYLSFDNFGVAFLVFIEVLFFNWSNVSYALQDSWGFLVIPLLIITLLCVYFITFASLAVQEFEKAAPSEETPTEPVAHISGYAWEENKVDKCIGKTNMFLQTKLLPIASSNWFINGVLVVVVINTLFLMIEHHGQSQGMTDFMDYANMVFTFIFCVELVFKLLGLGVITFFKSSWNVFDFVLIMLALIELGVVGSTALVALRALRLLRFLKLAATVDWLNEMVSLMITSLADTAWVVGLFALFVAMASIMGMQLFSNDIPVDPTPLRYGFSDFLESMVVVLQLLTRDRWVDIMHRTMDSVHPASAIYFLLVALTGQFFVMNRFLIAQVSAIPNKKTELEMMAPEMLRTGSGKFRRLSVVSHSQQVVPAEVVQASSWRMLFTWRPPESMQSWLRYFFFTGNHVILPPDTIQEAVKKTNITKQFELEEHEEHPGRLAVLKFVGTYGFEVATKISICFSCILFALHTPRTDADSTFGIVVWALDFSSLWLFAVEAALKMISHGFWRTPHAFFRSGTNILLLFIVVTGIPLDLLFFFSSQTTRTGRVTRIACRVLMSPRILRLLQVSSSVALITSRLVRASKKLLPIVLTLAMFLMLSATLATQLFAGLLFHCTDDSISNKEDCTSTFVDPSTGVTTARKWTVYTLNYNHLGHSLLTLFVVMNLDGWTEQMWLTVDGVSDAVAPQTNYSRVRFLFFLVFLMVVPFFLLNLFVAVLATTITELRDYFEGFHSMDEEQAAWLDTHRLFRRLLPATSHIRPPRKQYKRALQAHMVVNSAPYQIFVVVMILFNMALLATNHYQPSDAFHIFFVVAFAVVILSYMVDVFLKLVAYKASYWRLKWNIFDFLLTLLGMLGLLSYFIVQWELKATKILMQITCLKAFRLLAPSRSRTLSAILEKNPRLDRAANRLTLIVDTFMYCLPVWFMLVPVAITIFWLFACVGVDMFANVKLSEHLNVHANFRHFGISVYTLLRVFTRDRWVGIMLDSMKRPPDCDAESYLDCGSFAAPLFYIIFIVFGVFIVTNVFLAVVLDRFMYALSIEGAEISLEQLSRLKHWWRHIDPDGKCVVPTQDTLYILGKMGPPIVPMEGVLTPSQLLKVARNRGLYIPERRGMVHCAECAIVLLARILEVRLFDAKGVISSCARWNQWPLNAIPKWRNLPEPLWTVPTIPGGDPDGANANNRRRSSAATESSYNDDLSVGDDGEGAAHKLARSVTPVGRAARPPQGDLFSILEFFAAVVLQSAWKRYQARKRFIENFGRLPPTVITGTNWKETTWNTLMKKIVDEESESGVDPLGSLAQQNKRQTNNPLAGRKPSQRQITSTSIKKAPELGGVIPGDPTNLERPNSRGKPQSPKTPTAWAPCTNHTLRTLPQQTAGLIASISWYAKNGGKDASINVTTLENSGPLQPVVWEDLDEGIQHTDGGSEGSLQHYMAMP